jgi:hypothetical protein
MGWRMGSGEGYYNAVYRMFSALTPTDQDAYKIQHPEPPDWSDWYEMIRAHPWI